MSPKFSAFLIYACFVSYLCLLLIAYNSVYILIAKCLCYPFSTSFCIIGFYVDTNTFYFRMTASRKPGHCVKVGISKPSSPKVKKCFICKQSGHFFKTCPNNEATSKIPQCYYYFGSGHMKFNCPFRERVNALKNTSLYDMFALDNTVCRFCGTTRRVWFRQCYSCTHCARLGHTATVCPSRHEPPNAKPDLLCSVCFRDFLKSET